MMPRFLSRLFSLVLLLASVLTAPAFGQSVDRKTFSDAGAVVVQTDVGTIEVRTHDRREVRAEVRRSVDASWGRLSAREILAHFDVNLRRDGGRVVVEGHYRRDRDGRIPVPGGEMSRLQVHVVLHVPRDVDLDLRTGAGAIEVADIGGDVRAETGSGAITLGNVGGRVAARTASGPITVGDVGGDADLQTASGAVQTGHVRGRRSGGR